MTSIIISSNDQQLSQVLGEETAAVLDCTHLDRTLLDRVAERFEVQRNKLEQALDPATSRRLSTQERSLLLAYVETVVLESFQDDNVVCTGLAAHLYIRGVSHVLMVRALGEPKDLLKRGGTDGAPPSKAKKAIHRAERNASRWSTTNFGIDELDPSIYDLVLSVGQIDEGMLVKIITDLAGHRKFKPMTYSRNRLKDLLLASKVLIALLPEHPTVNVRVAGTRAIVHTTCSKRVKTTTINRIKKTARQVDGIESIEVHTSTPTRLIRRVTKAARIG
jgi:hypothetical protein